MVNLTDAILVLCPTANPLPGGNCQVGDSGSGPAITRWAVLDALGNPVTQPTPAQLSAVTAAQVAAYYTGLERSAGDGYLTAPDGQWKLQRAAILALVDYLNALQTWVTQFTAAVAAATSLANLQSRVAVLTVPPAITAANAKAAVKAKIDSGAAD